jgi:PAS domain S-box-containing protein
MSIGQEQMQKPSESSLPSIAAIYFFNGDGELTSSEIYGESSALPSVEDFYEIEVLRDFFKTPKDYCKSQITVGKMNYNVVCRKEQAGFVMVFSYLMSPEALLGDALIKRYAINQFVEPMVITDDKPHILWANKAWSKMTGYTPQEAIGKNPSEIVKSGRMQDAFYVNMWEPLIDNKPWFGRIINRRKDGRLYTEEMEIIPFHDAAGKKYYLAQKKEIYIDKDLLQTIKGENASKLFEISNNLMVLLSRDGLIQNINKNGAALLGYEKQELVGKNWFDTCLPEPIRNQVKEVFLNIINGNLELVKNYTNEVVTKNGSLLTIAWHNEFYTDEFGNLTAVISSGTDITDYTLKSKRIERQNDLLNLLREINKTIQSYRNRHDLIENVLDVFSKQEFIKASWIVISDDDKIEKIYQFGYEKSDFDTFILQKPGIKNFDCFHTGNSGKNTSFIDGKTGNRQCMSCVLYKYEPKGKVFYNKLVYNDVNFGYWVILFGEVDGYSSDDVSFISNINNSISLALYNIKIENEKQKIHGLLINSELQYRTIVESSLDTILIVDDNYTLEYVNNAVYNLLGYKPSELIGRNFKMLLSPESIELAVQRYKARQAGKSVPEKYEMTLLNKNGERRYVMAKIKAVKLNGRMKSFASLMDITELKIKTKALLDSEKKYRTFFQLDLSADYISTPSGELIDCNPAFLKLMGFDSLEEALLSEPSSFYTEGYSRENFIEEIKQKKFLENQERYYKTVSGKVIPVLENSVGIFDENGELVQVQGYIMDITKIKENEKKLRDALIKAQEADNLKTAFLNNISHEIRTPLNHIMGFAHLLHDNNIDNETRNSMLNTIEQSGNNLINLINDIIELSKFDSGNISINVKTVDINDLFKSVIEESKYIAGYYPDLKNIYSENDLSSEQFIKTDEKRLKQLLNILISNAFKFSGKCDITLRYGFEDNYLHVVVKDTGIGIRKQHLNIIFDRFRKIVNDAKQNISGTGLGLALAKEIVKRMGGEIWTESEFGIGSEFHFRIPIEFEENNKNNTEENVRRKNMQNLVILIAEDDESNFQLLKILLKPFKPEILRAWHGGEAIDIVKENENIDLILMDLKMPGIDGFMASVEIKRIRPELPIIAQTAYALIGDEEKALNSGCDFYISKPINHQKLKEIIKSALHIND